MGYVTSLGHKGTSQGWLKSRLGQNMTSLIVVFATKKRQAKVELVGKGWFGQFHCALGYKAACHLALGTIQQRK